MELVGTASSTIKKEQVWLGSYRIPRETGEILSQIIVNIQGIMETGKWDKWKDYGDKIRQHRKNFISF